MPTLNFGAIEKEARQLRNAELVRLQDAFLAKVSTYGSALVSAARSALTAIGNNLRHLFSWNPQAH
jgi:hypothetical protein